MEDIGMSPDYRSGWYDRTEILYTYTESDGFKCPVCGQDIEDLLQDEYAFLVTGDANDLDPTQTTITCSCGRKLTVRPLVTLDFEIEGER